MMLVMWSIVSQLPSSTRHLRQRGPDPLGLALQRSVFFETQPVQYEPLCPAVSRRLGHLRPAPLRRRMRSIQHGREGPPHRKPLGESEFLRLGGRIMP